MTTIEQRLRTLTSNLEAAIKTTPPSAPHLMILHQLKELAEIVEAVNGGRDPLPVYNIPQE